MSSSPVSTPQDGRYGEAATALFRSLSCAGAATDRQTWNLEVRAEGGVLSRFPRSEGAGPYGPLFDRRMEPETALVLEAATWPPRRCGSTRPGAVIGLDDPGWRRRWRCQEPVGEIVIDERSGDVVVCCEQHRPAQLWPVAVATDGGWVAHPTLVGAVLELPREQVMPTDRGRDDVLAANLAQGQTRCWAPSGGGAVEVDAAACRWTSFGGVRYAGTSIDAVAHRHELTFRPGPCGRCEACIGRFSVAHETRMTPGDPPAAVEAGLAALGIEEVCDHCLEPGERHRVLLHWAGDRGDGRANWDSSHRRWRITGSARPGGAGAPVEDVILGPFEPYGPDVRALFEDLLGRSLADAPGFRSGAPYGTRLVRNTWAWQVAQLASGPPVPCRGWDFECHRIATYIGGRDPREPSPDDAVARCSDHISSDITPLARYLDGSWTPV